MISSINIPNEVVVHPIVLLSVVDHYNRIAKGTRKRVVGVLLGEYSQQGKRVDITNIYAVPFEEDPRDPKIWFLDNIYHETMFHMFKKVNVRERLVGWYSSGPKLKSNDIQINEFFRTYMPNPIFVIVDVQMIEQLGIPTEAYCGVDEITEEGEVVKNFKHISCSVGADEVETVGVEHLIRDIKDVFSDSLVTQIMNKLSAMKALIVKMTEITDYLDLVLKSTEEGGYPVNNQILFNLQEIFNLLPNISIEKVVKSFNIKTNDLMLSTYICSLIRSIMSLHKLINNKIENIEKKKELEEKIQKEKEKKEQKEKEAKEKEAKEKEPNDSENKSSNSEKK